MTHKDLWGILSLVFLVGSALPYMRSIWIGKTRPHLFTQIIWGLVSGIAAAAQIAGHAGPGAWAPILSTVQSVIQAGLCLRHGDRDITRSDWIALGAALFAIPLWRATHDPLAAVIWVTAIDAIGYYPSFRKYWMKPREERTFYFFIVNMKHAASLCAMTVYSLTTLLYPCALFFMNTALIGMLLWRRRCVS